MTDSPGLLWWRRAERVLNIAVCAMGVALAIRFGFWALGSVAPYWLIWDPWHLPVGIAWALVHRHVERKQRSQRHVVTRAEAAERLRLWRESQDPAEPA